MKTFSSSPKHLPLLFVVLTLQLYACGSCFHEERMGLLEIKAFFNLLITTEEKYMRENNIPPSWFNDDPSTRENILSSWTDDPNSNCCRWEGIKCSRATSRVVQLSLDRMMPYHFSPNPWVLNLSLFHRFAGLQSLNFSYNRFDGLFDHMLGVKSFATLKEIKTLDFYWNDFNNNILPFLTAATSLRMLDIRDNAMEGAFPPKELANLAKLRVLKAGGNSFSFFSSQDLTNFKELEMLDLHLNQLNNSDGGQGLSFLTKLQTLDLSYNFFTDFSQLQVFDNLTNLEELDLSDNRLSDNHLLQALGNLTNLRTLDLSDNTFSGLVPIQGLMNLRCLEVLKLSSNQIEGFLTSQVFVNWTKLKALDLSNNLLAGRPQIQGICEFAHLRELDLSNNAIIDSLHCLGNLTYLRTLDLSNNQLSGGLTFLMSKLSSLEYLSLLGNNFEGSFSFSSLTNQSRLKVFKLSSNIGMLQVQTESSWIPPFQLKALQLHNCTLLGDKIPNFLLHQHDLRMIDLSYNKLIGVFPSWLLKNNTELRSISLRNNSLTKFLPPALVHGLSNLDISNNKIVGSIHESIGKIFQNLTSMNISNNGFHGVIPSSMGEIKGLWTLDMSYNSLSGQLPRKFYNCSSLRFLKLSNNKFKGHVFPEYSNQTNLRFLFLNSNNFTGIGKGLLKSSGLSILDISNNMLSGKIPSWIQNLTTLQILDVSDNNLSGSVPNNVNFSSLLELSLQNNNLVGSIPDALFEFSTLQLLDLRDNNFVGKIPNSVGRLSEIKVLLLQKNHLQGHIPNEICQLRKVNVLDLSHNRLSGFIPSCLGNMSFGMSEDWGSKESFESGMYISLGTYLDMNNFYTSALALSGFDTFYKPDPPVIVDFLTKQRYEHLQGVILQNIFGLDLSCNELSGDIPFQVGDLQNIHSLNLSHNRLIGSIPKSISRLENIESLDLSYNRLNGSIPAQLAQLNTLGSFNVSYNNLSGQIPFTGHLTTFDERSYTGNANICGEPTGKSCDSTSVPNSSTTLLVEEEEDDGAVIDMVWFYWSLGASYVTVLLGLFAFLCIDSHWSRAWFYRVDLCIDFLQRLKNTSIFK